MEGCLFVDFQELFRDNFVRLETFARRWSRTDAEDIVDDAFLKLLIADPVPDKPLAWLYRVIRNSCVNRSIRARRLPLCRDCDCKMLLSADEGVEVSYFYEILGNLPVNLREIVIKKLVDGDTFQQIADSVGMSRSSVHRDYKKGLEILRGLID
jgi:RNA polymerase sigma factor (sigma-70 family)